MPHILKLFCITITILTVSCQSQQYTLPYTDYSNAQSLLGNNVTKSVCELLEKYYAVKDALIMADEKSVISNCKDLRQQLQFILTDFKSELHPDTMVNILNNLINHSNEIINTQDHICEKHRVTFGLLSKDLLALINQLQLKNVTIFIQYSSTAFNETGAIWLSNHRAISNPYFGKKMIYEGDIIDSIF